MKPRTDWHPPKLSKYQMVSMICQQVKHLGFSRVPRFSNGSLTVNLHYYPVGAEWLFLEMLAQDVYEALYYCNTQEDAIQALLKIQSGILLAGG